MNICNLCKKNDATKKNSHIVPRFFGISLITTKNGERKGFKLDENKIGKKVKPYQDTPKEDYILCPDCETKLGELERVFSNEFFNKYQTDQQKSKATYLYSPNGYQYFQPKGVNYEKFKLLFYSILLRAQISSLEYFTDLQLSEHIAEELRQTLNGEIDFIDIPIIVLTTSNDFDKTRNYIYANSNTFDESFIWTNEYLTFFDFGSQHEMIEHFSDIKITIENGIRIGVLPIELWDHLRKLILKIKIDMIKGKTR